MIADYIMEHFAGLANWVASLTGAQQAWLGIGLTVLLWALWKFIQRSVYVYIKMHGDYEPFDDSWMDYDKYNR